MVEPFNLAAHEALLAAGYTYEREPEFWEDDGDAENGPHLSGYPAFDRYTSQENYVFVDEYGMADFEVRDHAREAYEAEMEQANDY